MARRPLSCQRVIIALTLTLLVLGQLKQIMDAAVERAGKFQGKDGGRHEDVVLYGVHRLARNANEVGELRLGETGVLPPLSQMRS